MLWDALSSSSGTLLIVLTFCLVIAGLLKGIIGVGMPIVALPLLSMLIDVRAAVMLLAVPLVLSNIPQALEGGRTLECLKRLVPVLFGMMPGIVLGATILLSANPAAVKGIAGFVIVLVAGLTWAAPKFELRENVRTPVGLGAGFAGGLLGGVAALPGPLVFTYLLAKGLRGKDFTKEASLFLVISSALLAGFLASSSAFDRTDLVISTSALIPVAVGMVLGQKLRERVPADVFKKAVLVAVLLSGLGLVCKSID